MNTWLKIAAALVVTVGLAACTAQQQLETSGKKALTAAEMKKRFKGGAAVDWVTPKGAKGSDVYVADGSAYRISETAKKEGPGSWRLAGNKLCTKWETFNGGKESCVTLYKIAKKKYKAVNPDGSLAADMKFN